MRIIIAETPASAPGIGYAVSIVDEGPKVEWLRLEILVEDKIHRSLLIDGKHIAEAAARDPATAGFVVKCHKGFDQRELMHVLMSRNLWPEKKNGATQQIIATYDYTDERGELLYQVVRKAPKDFVQRRPDGKGGWILNLQGFKPVPYRLPECSRRSRRASRSSRWKVRRTPRRCASTASSPRATQRARESGLTRIRYG